MSSAPAVSLAPSPPSSDAVLSWRVHGLRQHPERVPLVAGAYAVALALWWLAFPVPVALFLPLVALTGAMSEYLFPISYRLTPRGAFADCGFARLALDWKDVRRATHGSDGIYLSPLSRPSRLDTFRGIRLRYLPDNPQHAEQVRQTVRDLRDQAKGAA